MAQTKKKKKAGANPARGFATTSIPSKAKPSSDVSKDVSPERPAVATDHAQSVTSSEVPAQSADTAGQSLQDLSPEELEKHLEESELQNLVEQYGPKSAKDAARQVTKLETERRTLRPAAIALHTSRWLPAELMEQIVDFAKAEGRSSQAPQAGNKASEKQLGEEDLCVKLWTLRRVLLKLGFPDTNVQEALQQILHIHRSRSLPAGKDTLWGLEESLNWLAMYASSDALTDYDTKRVELAIRGPTDSPALDSQSGTPNITSAASGAATPIKDSRVFSHFSLKAESDPETTPDLKHTTFAPSYSFDDSDEDLEPEAFIPEWLAAKKRLFDVQPSHYDQTSARSRNSHAMEEPLASELATEIDLLRKKITKIEKDVLFDHDEAAYQWNEMLNTLRKEAAQRKRFEGIINRPKLAAEPVEQVVTATEVSGSEDESDSITQDDASVFGDIFTPAENGEPEATSVESGDKTVQLRDFGKWTGLSPKRLLEETCKARDPSCKLSYRLVSLSSYAIRHGVTIKWSRTQDFPPSVSFPMVSHIRSPDLTSATMVSIAVPTTTQSEAYISTVLLFFLFSEDKAHLRLPTVWREYWNELAKIKAEKDDASDRDTLRELKRLINDSPNDEKDDEDDDDDIVLTKNFAQRNKRNGTSDSTQKSETAGENNPENLKNLWLQRMASPAYQRMAQSRSTLPIWASKQDILAAIMQRQAVIICSETGSGKSTQVPSFILENELMAGRHCKIYVTEPRRISAITLARRVSEELGEYKNDVGTARSLVGYAIRLESRLTRSTRLVFATTGVVVRMLERPNDLLDVTHIVLDEVHERSIDSDFLLIVLRRLMHERPSLKVVLMSATVDAQKFAEYLDGAPILNISGRTFPVEVNYLEDAVELTGHTIGGRRSDGELVESEDLTDDEAKKSNTAALAAYNDRTRRTIAASNEYRLDYQLIVALLATIARNSQLQQYSQAILVFMPGLAEIRKLNDEINAHPNFARGWQVYQLHSTISGEDQERAFLVPPPGVKKIVIATNIAETGITIPDITAVIDAGKEKVMRFDERRQLSKLVEAFISRANAKQRRGRAGRVQPGICFHLFTKDRHDRLLPENQTPEMLRLSLQDLVLRVKICSLGGIEQTLSEALDPPTIKNIRRAVTALKDVKALTATEELTALGRQLARLPLDVFLGKLVLNGIVFHCLDVAVTVAAILSSKSPFITPVGASTASADLACLAFRKGDSDLLTSYNAYCAWKRVRTTPSANITEYQFCRKNFLSSQTLSSIEDLKMQLLVSLADSGLLQLSNDEGALLSRSRINARHRTFFSIPTRFDANATNEALINAVIAWSFYPKLLVREGKGWRNVANNQSVTLSPTSVNKRSVDGFPLPQWLSFYHIMQSQKSRMTNAHETTAVEDVAIVLGCGDAEFKMWAGVIILDNGRLRFRVKDWRTMLALKVMREAVREGQARWLKGTGRGGASRRLEDWLELWKELFDVKQRQTKMELTAR